MHEPDELVPDPIAQRELQVGPMTFYRWDHSSEQAALGWPPAIRISRGKTSRKFRSRRQLEKFKANLLQAALKTRARKHRAALDVREHQAA
jgi:hypothetical protein